MISVGDSNHVWALDTSDRLYMRQETSSPAFPEGIELFLLIESKKAIKTFEYIKKSRFINSCFCRL